MAQRHIETLPFGQDEDVDEIERQIDQQEQLTSEEPADRKPSLYVHTFERTFRIRPLMPKIGLEHLPSHDERGHGT